MCLCFSQSVDECVCVCVFKNVFQWPVSSLELNAVIFVYVCMLLNFYFLDALMLDLYSVYIFGM